MALTKQDINAIKGAIDSGIGKKIDDKIENLAGMIKRGFDETATKEDFKRLDLRMDKFDGRMDRFENSLAHIDAQITAIDQDIVEMRKDLIPRMEIEDILARLLLVERKLGIVSGK